MIDIIALLIATAVIDSPLLILQQRQPLLH